METRKAQLTGGSTYTVSLPKDWASDIDLETGDTLRLFPRDRTLIIEPTGNEGADGADRGTHVDVDRFSDTDVRRTVQAVYTAGFNRIELASTADLNDHRRVIAETARGFIGLETLESTDTHVTLQSLLDSATVSVEQATVQLEQVALSMHADAIVALLEGDEDLAEHVVERDNEVDRLHAMLSRHFQRSLVDLRETEALGLDQSELYDYRTTGRQLERVGDHAEKIATLALQFEQPPPDDFAEKIERVGADARGLVERAASTIIGDGDVGTAYDALDRRDELTTDLQDLERELHERDVPESHLIALALDSLLRTAEYGGNIAEAALQAAARDGRL